MNAKTPEIKPEIKTVIVFGAGGYIGRHLYRKLEVDGHAVYRVSLQDPGYKTVLGDICRTHSPGDIAAVILSWNQQSPSANIAQLEILLDDLTSSGIANVSYISTEAPRADSRQDYALAKWQCERLALSHGFKVIRLGYIFGGGGEKWRGMKATSRASLAPAPCGDAIIRPQHVYDAVRSIQILMDRNFSVCAVRSGFAISLSDFITLVRGRAKGVVSVPSLVFLFFGPLLRRVNFLPPVRMILGLANLTRGSVGAEMNFIAGKATARFISSALCRLIDRRLQQAKDQAANRRIDFDHEEFGRAWQLLRHSEAKEITSAFADLNRAESGKTKGILPRRIDHFANNVVLLFARF